MRASSRIVEFVARLDQANICPPYRLALIISGEEEAEILKEVACMNSNPSFQAMNGSLFSCYGIRIFVE